MSSADTHTHTHCRLPVPGSGPDFQQTLYIKICHSVSAEGAARVKASPKLWLETLALWGILVRKPLWARGTWAWTALSPLVSHHKQGYREISSSGNTLRYPAPVSELIGHIQSLAVDSIGEVPVSYVWVDGLLCCKHERKERSFPPFPQSWFSIPAGRIVWWLTLDKKQ